MSLLLSSSVSEAVWSLSAWGEGTLRVGTISSTSADAGDVWGDSGCVRCFLLPPIVARPLEVSCGARGLAVLGPPCRSSRSSSLSVAVPTSGPEGGVWWFG